MRGIVETMKVDTDSLAVMQDATKHITRDMAISMLYWRHNNKEASGFDLTCFCVRLMMLTHTISILRF